MSIVVHLPFICTRKLKLWNALWIFITVYWRENTLGKKKQFTSIDSFFVHDSFLRLLGVSFAFHSKCVLFIIINDVFVLLYCVEALIKTGVSLCWMVCQTQITVHALENLQINWKGWSCKVQKASCKPVRKLDVHNFRWELGSHHMLQKVPLGAYYRNNVRCLTWRMWFCFAVSNTFLFMTTWSVTF